MKYKRVLSLILVFAMILSFLPSTLNIAYATEEDLTVASVFNIAGTSAESFETGKDYNIDIDASIQGYTEPILEITVPKNITVKAYPTSSDATLGPNFTSEGVTKETAEDGSTILTYHFKSGATPAVGFSVTLTPTHKLEDNTTYTTTVKLFDGETLSATKTSAIKTNNVSLKVGAVYAEHATDNSRCVAVKYDGVAVYLPFNMYVTAKENHYAYKYVKTVTSIPSAATPVVKTGNTYTPLVSGEKIQCTNMNITYYDNYDEKGKAIVCIYEENHTLSQNIRSSSINPSNNDGLPKIYLEYGEDTAYGTYKAAYTTQVSVGLTGGSELITKASSAVTPESSISYYYIYNQLKEYNVSDFLYTYYSTSTRYARNWNYTPLEGRTPTCYLTPMNGDVTLNASLVNNTGEEIDSITVEYNLPQEIYTNDIKFNLSSNDEATNTAQVSYKTKNGGEELFTANLTYDDFRLTLDDASDAITYMKVVYDKVPYSSRAQYMWTAGIANKDSIGAYDNPTTKTANISLISAQGTNKLPSIGAQAIHPIEFRLLASYNNYLYQNLIFNGNSNESQSVSKGDTFAFSFYTSDSTPVYNPEFTIVVPSDYIFMGINPFESMYNATYEYSSRELIVNAEAATTLVPAGTYTIYHIQYNDDIAYDAECVYNRYDYWSGMEFLFKVGPMTDTSSLKSGLKVPLVMFASSGNEYYNFYVSSMNEADKFDLDGDGNVEETLDYVYNDTNLTINSSRAVIAQGFATSSTNLGESNVQSYQYNTTGEYRFYMYNGLAEGNTISGANIEFELGRDGSTFTYNDDYYTSHWNVILDGVPTLEGDFFDGASVLYKYGDAEYTADIPQNAVDFAAVTKVKIQTATTGSAITLDSLEGAIVKLPIKSDFTENTQIGNYAYINTTVAYDYNEATIEPQVAPVSFAATAVKISGTVYDDFNGNGVIDDNEKYVEGEYGVSLYAGDEATGEPLYQCNTGDSHQYNGRFIIETLRPGTYTIKVDKHNEQYYPIINTDLFDDNGCYTFTISTESTDPISKVNLGIISPRHMYVNEDYFNVIEGTTRKIVPVVYPNLMGLEEILFESSDPSIVTVSDDGVLTYVSAGEAKVTVSVPQSEAALAIDSGLDSTLTYEVDVNALPAGCYITANPFVSKGSSYASSAITACDVAYSENPVNTNLYYYFNRAYNGYCTEDHARTKNVVWSIESDTGAMASIETYQDNSAYNSIKLSATPDARVDHTVVLKAEETWTHDTDNKPEPIFITVTVCAKVHAEIGNYTVKGALDVNMDDFDGNEINVTLFGDKFVEIPENTNVSNWFTNLPSGMTAVIKTKVEAGANVAAICISGQATQLSSEKISLAIPYNYVQKRTAVSTTDTETAVFSIVSNYVHAANDAELADMRINVGSFSPVFKHTIISYSNTQLSRDIENIELTLRTRNPQATYQIKVNDTVIENGQAATQIPLADEITVIEIIVTSSDENVSKTYTLTLQKSEIASYNLTVNFNGGNGENISGSYEISQIININAGTKEGYLFNGWISNNGGTFADANSAITTFTMPGNDVVINANWSYVNSEPGYGPSPAPAPTPTPVPSPVPSEPVVIDGVEYNIGMQVVEEDTTTVTIDKDKLIENVNKADNGSNVIVPVSNNTNKRVVQLVVQNIVDMAQKDMTLIIKSGDVSYNIPTTAIDTDALVDALGGGAENLPISVIITKADADTSSIINNIASSEGFNVVINPIEFSMTASYNGNTVEINKFNNYVAREIEITAEQAKKITTAIVTEKNGSVRHVPTYVYTKDGKWFAKINSRTNSVYTLIYNEAEFADAKGKWYEATVTEMASRKIINGKDNDTFAGDNYITRAEFAAIIIRALGLPTDSTSANRFTDVSKNAWYYGAIGTAYEYGLINGTNTNQTVFDPMANITRQEAMAMIQRAAKVAEYTGLSDTDLTEFSDVKSISNWAKESVEFNINNGFIIGSNGKINPEANITRAETATVVLRLLQKANLVDIRTQL